MSDDDQLNVITNVVGAWIYQRDRKSLSGRAPAQDPELED